MMGKEDYDEYEIMFNQEVRDKKRTARGARANSGRRGGGNKGIQNAISFPSDLLKHNNKKLYKEYIRGGEIKVSNAYSDINQVPKIDEFNEMEFNKRKGLLVLLRELHSTTKLIKYWGINQPQMYKILREHEIELKKIKGGWNKKKQNDAENTKGHKSNPLNALVPIYEPKIETIQVDKVYIPPSQKGFTVSLNGCYGKEELEKRLQGMMGALFGKKYTVNITFEEVE